MKISELPTISLSKPGYERLWCFPDRWPAWKELDGRCFALAFDGGPLPDGELCKEEIPSEVYERIHHLGLRSIEQLRSR